MAAFAAIGLIGIGLGSYGNSFLVLCRGTVIHEG